MDIQKKQLNIIVQLMNGWHLDPNEIETAKELLNRLNNDLKKRLN
jgi:hypothetical protein